MSLVQALVEAVGTEVAKAVAEWASEPAQAQKQEGDMGCSLCGQADDPSVHVVARSREWRVVRVIDNPDHPAFWRVIWNDHVAEMSDLTPDQRSALMQVVATVETVVRRELQPHKINLASLGNVVPHLHWHVIARWAEDPHFPQPVWGTRQREAPTAHLMRLEVDLPRVDRALQAELMKR